jgi:hypothetical protein
MNCEKNFQFAGSLFAVLAPVNGRRDQRRDRGEMAPDIMQPRARQLGSWAARVGRPTAFHAWKPPSRSVAWLRPIRRSVAAARVEA